MKLKQLSLKEVFKKYYWVFILAAMAIIVLLYNVIPSAYASPNDYTSTVDKFESFLAGFGITGFSKMLEAYNVFSEFVANDGGLVATVSHFITGIAAFMVLLFTLLNVIKESMRGEIDMDYWFRIFASAAVGVLVVTSTNTVMNRVYDLGNLVATNVEQSLESAVKSDTKYTGDKVYDLKNESALIKNDKSSPGYKALMKALVQLPGMENAQDIIEKKEIADTKWYAMQQVGENLQLLTYVVYLPMIICIFLMFSAVFELKVRQIFAPMALAAVAYEGARSSGVRYIKKFLACSIKIAVYFCIAAIGAMLTYFFYNKMILSSNTDEEILLYFIMMILSNIVAGLSMMQSGGLGDEIVGV